MRIFFKTFGLGTLFLFLGLVAYIIIASFFGGIRVGGHSTGVNGLIEGLIGATIFNVWFWLLVLVAYGWALWIVKR